MTTIDLINIVTKKAGVKDTDAKLFFEIFIKKLADKMKPGESAKFSDVGYFHLRTSKNPKAEIQNDSILEKGKNYVILFSKQLDQKDELDKNIILNIHSVPDADRDEIDSYFSLSVGKPVFQTGGVNNDETLGGQSKNELRESFQSKAELLLNSVEKLVGVTGEKEIELEKSDLSRRKSNLSRSDLLSDEPSISGEDSFPSPEDNRKNARDFVEDISNKIRNENSNKKQREERPGEKTDKTLSEKLPWNFGREVFDKKVEYKREDSEDLPVEEKKDEIKHDKETKQGSLPVELAGRTEDDSETFIVDDKIDADETDLGTEQKPDLTEKEIEQDEKLKSILDEYITRNEPEKFGAFQRVKSFVADIKKDNENVDDALNDEPEEEFDTEIDGKEIETTEEEFKQVQSKLTEYHLEDEKVKLKKEKKSVEIKKTDKKDKYLYKRKKRNVVPFIVAFFSIVFIVAIVYLYLESDTIFKSDEAEDDVKTVVRPSSVNVIDREYLYPITYPYTPAANEQKIAGINLGLFPDEKIVFKPPVPKQELENKKEETTIVADNEKKNNEESIGSVGKNIYKYKDYFVVQVASFQSYSIAEEEAKKYESMGYNAFVEIAEITDQGTWFRLRVGDFTTMEKANSFALKYIK